MQVVVASDDPAIREEAERGFPAGVAVATARDARDAMSLMRSAAPDLVIVDLQTGSAGGFALARDMRHLPHLHDVPVLMLLERDQDVWLARQAGANRCVRKPVDVGNLVEAALSVAAPPAK